jgi:hypothetical protein
MEKINLNTTIIALFVVFCSTLTFKYLQTRNDQAYSLQVNNARNLVYSLRDIRMPHNIHLTPNDIRLDSNLSLQLNKSKYSLIVLFEPNQCGACLDEKKLWNEISESGLVPVYGITYLKDKKELNKYLKDSKTEIPVYQDTLALIGKHLLPQGVPVKLLVNKNHEIIFADYVRSTEKERKKFVKYLKYYVNNF